MITANGRFDDEFFKIVYAEQALLRAEFDELITAARLNGRRRQRPPPPRDAVSAGQGRRPLYADRAGAVVW